MDGIERTFVRVRLRQYRPAIFTAACVIVAGSALKLHMATAPVDQLPNIRTSHLEGLKDWRPRLVPRLPMKTPSIVPSNHTTDMLSVDPTSSGGDGGSLCPLTDKNNAVRVKREDIRITVSDYGFYSVLVDSVFKNEGPAANVPMAVPESGVDGKDGILGVSIRVVGRQAAVYRKVVDLHGGDSDGNALWVIHVPFQHEQSRHIRVRYHSCVDNASSEGMTYTFADDEWLDGVEERTLTLIDGSTDGGADFIPSINGKGIISMHHKGRYYTQCWAYCTYFNRLFVTL